MSLLRNCFDYGPSALDRRAPGRPRGRAGARFVAGGSLFGLLTLSVPASASTVTIVGTLVDNPPADSGFTFEIELVASSGAPVHTLRLDCGPDTTCRGSIAAAPGSWIVRSPADGSCWFRPVPIQVSGGTQEVQLDAVHPRVHLEVSTARRLEQLTARFRVAGASPFAFEDATECASHGEAWSCRLPATRLDLRFESDGALPVHLWNMPVTTSQLAGAPLQFEPGASVALWVDGLGPRESPAVAHLVPLDASSPAANRPVPVNLAALHRDASRAFLFAGPVPPGRYEIRVARSETPEARPPVVRVAPGESWLLPTTLRLQAPSASLRVSVTPAVSPAGGRWVLRLLAGDPGAGPVEEHSRVEFEGSVTVPSLTDGTYAAQLLDSTGSPWVTEIVRISGAPQSIEFDFGAVPIQGTVLLGDSPLPEVSLYFRLDGSTARFTTDGEGRYAGALPSEGTWSVRVMCREPQIDRRVEVDFAPSPGDPAGTHDIVLPDLGIAGRVVQANGENAPRAVVSFLRTDGAVAASGGVVTDDEGEFRISALDPGDVTLWADHESGASDETEVEIDEERGGPDDVRLVLRERTKVRGRLVGPSGPVAGGRLEYRSGRSPALSVVEAPTVEPDGSFEFEVAAGSLPLLVTAHAPQLATVVQVVGSADEPIEVFLPSDVAPVVVFDPSSKNPSGIDRTVVLIRQALPLLEGPTGALRRVVSPDSTLSVRGAIVPGPFEACSGTYLELHELLVTGRRPPTMSCATAVALAGVETVVPLGPTEAADSD